MMKTVMKEIMIILLLCVAILLVLCVLLYDYNPINKVVPNKVAYSTPENVRNELEEENLESTLSVENKVYTIDGSDLNIYKKSNTYNPSKQNPFATTPTENTPVSSGATGVDTNLQNPSSGNSTGNTANTGSTGNTNTTNNSTVSTGNNNSGTTDTKLK